MPFSIGFLDEPPSYPYDDPATPETRGVLILGEAKEYFGSSLYQWSKKEYETQWRHAIRALLDGNDRAALITEYVGPQAATHLEWWPMYVVGNSVFIQNHFLFYDQFAEPFSVQNPFSLLRDRRTTNEKGEKISEWALTPTPWLAPAEVAFGDGDVAVDGEIGEALDLAAGLGPFDF
jgi:hypothetical protein